jgi:hypothetical protein
MEQTERSGTKEYKLQTPVNYSEGSTQHSEHGESLKSRKIITCFFTRTESSASKGKAIPFKAWTGFEGSRSQISRQSAREVGKVVSCMDRPLLPSGNIPGIHLCQRLSQRQCHSAAGRIMLMKNSITPSGIKAATFRLVAQCINKLRHR